MAKTTSYILMVIGLVLIALALMSKSVLDKMHISSLWLSITGIVFIAAGFLLIKGSGKPRLEKEEVPIFKGNKIVGYRKEA